MVCERTEGAGRTDGWGVYVTVYHYHLILGQNYLRKDTSGVYTQARNRL